MVRFRLTEEITGGVVSINCHLERLLSRRSPSRRWRSLRRWSRRLVKNEPDGFESM